MTMHATAQPKIIGDLAMHHITLPLRVSHAAEDGTVIDDTGREVFRAANVHVAAILVATINRDAGFVLAGGRAVL